jgi:hypothetical protein
MLFDEPSRIAIFNRWQIFISIKLICCSLFVAGFILIWKFRSIAGRHLTIVGGTIPVILMTMYGLLGIFVFQDFIWAMIANVSAATIMKDIHFLILNTITYGIIIACLYLSQILGPVDSSIPSHPKVPLSTSFLLTITSQFLCLYDFWLRSRSFFQRNG